MSTIALSSAALPAPTFEATQAGPGLAASSAAELAKRRAHGLTPAQEANLARWGYPYVMEDFRFHVTVSGALAPEALDRLEALLQPLVAPFTTAPLAIAELALFEQADPAQPFRLTRRFPFGLA